MTGWTVLVLGLIVAAIVAIIVRAAGWLEPRYRGRHRSPGPAHPAWLAMDRVDDGLVAAEVDAGMAAIEAMLEEQSR